MIDQMNSALRTMPGIEPSFSQPIRDNVLESISQIDGQIVIKVFGDDMDTLRRLAGEVLHDHLHGAAASRARSSTAAGRCRSSRSRSIGRGPRATA